MRDTRDQWSGRPFLAPEGVRMVRIDRRSGQRVFDAWPTEDPMASVIWEAFKPDTEPRRTGRQNQTDQLRQLILAQLRRGEDAEAAADAASDDALYDFVEEQGGLY